MNSLGYNVYTAESSKCYIQNIVDVIVAGEKKFPLLQTEAALL